MSSVSADSCRARGRYLIFLLPRAIADHPGSTIFPACKLSSPLDTREPLTSRVQAIEPQLSGNRFTACFSKFLPSLYFILSFLSAPLDHNENDNSTKRYDKILKFVKRLNSRFEKVLARVWIVVFLEFFSRKREGGDRSKIFAVLRLIKKKKEKEKSNAARTKRCLGAMHYDRSRTCMHARIFRCRTDRWEMHQTGSLFPRYSEFRECVGYLTATRPKPPSPMH